MNSPRGFHQALFVLLLLMASPLLAQPALLPEHGLGELDKSLRPLESLVWSV